ncbi:MAG: ABC transporter ATP-binding protein [Eubacteriaceae bacterium]|jgi:ABC-2 type transport system ATP-binding protein|nr:ABC transporter ATP-binding protein [Eubacteriaceae bacterium]
MELLTLENVSKQIKKKEIVKSISLHVDSGEIVGFVGPNGAGKTTTIKMIMGLFSISGGDIRISGFDIKKDFEKAMSTVGGIIENPDLYLRLTGRRNLEYLAALHGEEAVKNIDAVVSLVKMAGRIDDKLSTYSLGMRQRIGLAQALSHMPSLLILDEPTNGLDPIGIKEFRDIMISLAKDSGLGVLISSHLLSEIEMVCDRVYIISNGEIIEERAMKREGSESGEVPVPYEFVCSRKEEAASYFLSLGLASEDGGQGLLLNIRRDDVPSAVKGLVEAGVDIYSVSPHRRSLEADFISLTQESNAQIR